MSDGISYFSQKFQRSHILVLLILFCFLVGIYLKLPKASLGQARAPDLISILEAQGLRHEMTHKPVNRGEFDLHIFKDENCEGYIATMLLTRNSEGASILAHVLKKPRDDIRFIYDNTLHLTFPAFEYWMRTSLLRSGKKHVVAATEIGDCKLLSVVDWSQV